MAAVLRTNTHPNNNVCPICMTVRSVSMTATSSVDETERTKRSIQAQRAFYFDEKSTRRRRRM